MRLEIKVEDEFMRVKVGHPKTNKYVWIYFEELEVALTNAKQLRKMLSIFSEADLSDTQEQLLCLLNSKIKNRSHESRESHEGLGYGIQLDKVPTPEDSTTSAFERHKILARNKLEEILCSEEKYFIKNRIDKVFFKYIIDYEDLYIFKLSEDNQDEADRQYRNIHLLRLLKVFDNCCARCGVSNKGIHLDHFMVPRSKGGSFLLETHSGFKVHNALPLCESCNTSKGDKNYRKFFSGEELIRIFSKFETFYDLNTGQ